MLIVITQGPWLNISRTIYIYVYIYIYISFLLVTSLLSHDLASWSEGQSREAVLQHGDLLSNYFIGMQKMRSKFRSMYKNLHLLTKRLGSSFVTAWSDSLMQGMQDYSDSWLHSHISKFVINKFNQLADLPKMLTAQRAHNIDDVLLTIKTESKISSKVAEKTLWSVGINIQRLGIHHWQSTFEWLQICASQPVFHQRCRADAPVENLHSSCSISQEWIALSTFKGEWNICFLTNPFNHGQSLLHRFYQILWPVSCKEYALAWLPQLHLVGGFNHFLCSIIYGIILPIDFHIKMVKTTSQSLFLTSINQY